MDEGLAGNASVVQALAAESVPFHEEDPLPPLGGSDRSGIAPGTPANHDDVSSARHGRTKGRPSLMSLRLLLRGRIHSIPTKSMAGCSR